MTVKSEIQICLIFTIDVAAAYTFTVSIMETPMQVSVNHLKEMHIFCLDFSKTVYIC